MGQLTTEDASSLHSTDGSPDFLTVFHKENSIHEPFLPISSYAFPNLRYLTHILTVNTSSICFSIIISTKSCKMEYRVT